MSEELEGFIILASGIVVFIYGLLNWIIHGKTRAQKFSGQAYEDQPMENETEESETEESTEVDYSGMTEAIANDEIAV